MIFTCVDENFTVNIATIVMAERLKNGSLSVDFINGQHRNFFGRDADLLWRTIDAYAIDVDAPAPRWDIELPEG